MNEESGNSNYDNLLLQARGSAKHWIPKLCEALKNENPEMTPHDIKERVKKDCISIWQRYTITDALPDEYKDKAKSDAGKKGRQKQLINLQANGTAITTEGLSDSNRANSVSNAPSEQYSRIDNSSYIANPENHVKRQQAQTIEELEQITSPDPVMKFFSGKGVISENELINVNEKKRKLLTIMLQSYEDRIQKRVNSVKGKEGEEVVPLSLYVIDTDIELVPIILLVSFKKNKISVKLEKRAILALDRHTS